MNQLATLTLAIVLALATWERGHANQVWDYTADDSEHEVAAIANGQTTCGIAAITHHPLLHAYLTVPVRWAGLNTHLVPVAGASIVTALLVAVLGLGGGIMNALPLGIALLAALALAPGYGAWLAFPIENSWSVTCAFGLILAAVTLPWWGMVAAVFVTAWFSIDLVVIHAAMVAAALVAVHGVSWRTIGTGVASVVAYCVAFGMHFVQVCCHFGWNLAAVWSDYVSNPAGTNLMLRVSDLPLSGRIASAQTLAPQYLSAVLTDPQWSTPWFWLVAGAALLASRPSMRGLGASAVLLVGFAAWFLLVPGLLAPHLHVLPRVLLLLPLGAVALCGAAKVGGLSA